jgi:hypothetical protein
VRWGVARIGRTVERVVLVAERCEVEAVERCVALGIAFGLILSNFEVASDECVFEPYNLISLWFPSLCLSFRPNIHGCVVASATPAKAQTRASPNIIFSSHSARGRQQGVNLSVQILKKGSGKSQRSARLRWVGGRTVQQRGDNQSPTTRQPDSWEEKEFGR